MMPLPPEPFELSEWKMATVQMNYHIQVNKMNYSVPYEYVGKRVEVRQTNSIVEIYYKGTRICSHARLHGRANQYLYMTDGESHSVRYMRATIKPLVRATSSAKRASPYRLAS